MSLLNLTTEDNNTLKPRTLKIIAASLTKELVQGNGSAKWKGWLHRLERITKGQRGNNRTQMKAIRGAFK